MNSGDGVFASSGSTWCGGIVAENCTQWATSSIMQVIYFCVHNSEHHALWIEFSACDSFGMIEAGVLTQIGDKD
jgi:hypothetical protein